MQAHSVSTRIGSFASGYCFLEFFLPPASCCWQVPLSPEENAQMQYIPSFLHVTAPSAALSPLPASTWDVVSHLSLLSASPKNSFGAQAVHICIGFSVHRLLPIANHRYMSRFQPCQRQIHSTVHCNHIAPAFPTYLPVL